MGKIAIIGTNGIPANYGGFETLAENLVNLLSDKYKFIVYCSKSQKKVKKDFSSNVEFVNLPLNANGWQSILYDSISIIHAWFKTQTLLILGPVAGFILPLNIIFRKRIIVNHGGLNEWEREKYNFFQQRLIKLNYNLAAKFASVNVSDNSLLKESIYQNFKRESVVIRYGGDHAVKVEPTSKLIEKYPFLNLEYFVSVSRAQIDNNLHLVLDAFARTKNKNLVLVSNWSISEYGRELYKKYHEVYQNIFLLEAVYDKIELNCIRSNSMAYIHSHTRCGTSPSLVEAICLNLPIISIDIPTNRETLNNIGLYFKDSNDLKKILVDSDPSVYEEIPERIKILSLVYKWENIVGEYEILLNPDLSKEEKERTS